MWECFLRLQKQKSGLAHDTEVWFLDSIMVVFSHRPCIAYHRLLITHQGLPLWHSLASCGTESQAKQWFSASQPTIAYSTRLLTEKTNPL